MVHQISEEGLVEIQGRIGVKERGSEAIEASTGAAPKIVVEDGVGARTGREILLMCIICVLQDIGQILYFSQDE